MTKLAKADFSQLLNPYGTQPTYAPYQSYTVLYKYHDLIRQCRFFYENDTIAGTVIDRIADIANTPIRNRHRRYSKEIKNYYDGIAELLAPLIKTVMLMYLIDGMAIPEVKTDRVMGNRIHQDLGRTRYSIPRAVWVRDNANIILKKTFTGERAVYQKIPMQDINLITQKGKPDREQEYQDLVSLYPEYVEAVLAGKTIWRLEDCKPITRRLLPYNDYPVPYLTRSMEALNFRRSLKRMDKVTSERVINAIRQIKVGSDEFPSDDEDITAAKNVIQQQSGNTQQDTLLNVYTNHTITIEWIVPPIEHLLDSEKYIAANSDVFLGLGFPRLWIAGENERSNSSDNGIAATGPISMIEGARDDILDWIKSLYAKLADENGFTQYPDPFYNPISLVEYSELLQYAAQFIENDTISRDTVAQIYNTTFDREQAQITYETSVLPKQEESNDNPPIDQNNVTREGMGQETEEPE